MTDTVTVVPKLNFKGLTNTIVMRVTVTTKQYYSAFHCAGILPTLELKNTQTLKVLHHL